MLSLLISGGCGGKDKAAPATTTMPHEHEGRGGHEGGEGEEHAGMSPEMTQFHEVLRPHWHAEKGPARMKGTCDAIAQFQTGSDAIAKATPPEPTNADTWTAGTRALVAAVKDLEPACKASDSAGFETSFTRVHEAFHALMEAGATHGKGGGGGDGGSKEGSGSAGSPATTPAPHEHKHGGH